MAQVTTNRDGMDFTGDEVTFTLGVAGKTMEDVKEFADLMWGGPQKGDIAVLYNGTYYVCDGVDPDTGEPFTDQQVAEIERAFEDGAVTFL